ncbi:MAG: hypothetical protein AVDCRST_MAG51-3055 [uncultured Ramlibacter sp.]|uniref:Glycine zipper 2TM domain-containing protein n=1 Tax=uncultured Ramlibacter sp. TaxID=260755 RepID=A0A6J4QEW1_9BURK|nr:MAG: hypothetical protein AVDCRST_MAG51-3055 [uncultured Ramlibacter sp.]
MWAAIGVLALAAAGLGGALVMRSADKPAAPVAAQSVPATQTATSGTQAPANQVQSAQAERAAKPAPAKPVQQSKPAPQVAQGSNYTPIETSRAAVCTTCGTVEAVMEVKQKGEGTGIGAVGGAVVGGLLGNQVGGGNGKKAMTVIGAVGGGLAGHEAEKHVRATTAYDVQVRMEDGSRRTIRQAQPVAVGSRVTVEGSSLRVGGGSRPSAPRTLQTSAGST